MLLVARAIGKRYLSLHEDTENITQMGLVIQLPSAALRDRSNRLFLLALEQSILAEANLVHVLETNRSDPKKLFAKDSPNNISLSTRVSQSLMKPIQQQLSTALGDKDPSTETQLVKQVCFLLCGSCVSGRFMQILPC